MFMLKQLLQFKNSINSTIMHHPSFQLHNFLPIYPHLISYLLHSPQILKPLVSSHIRFQYLKTFFLLLNQSYLLFMSLQQQSPFKVEFVLCRSSDPSRPLRCCELSNFVRLPVVRHSLPSGLTCRVWVMGTLGIQNWLDSMSLSDRLT